MQSKTMRCHSFIQTSTDKEKDKILRASIRIGKKNPLMYCWEDCKTGIRFQGNQIICNKSTKNI